MNHLSIPMAVVDFIPVAMFFMAAVLLQRDLYNKMVKGAFALLAAGSIMVLVGGIYKATWKILYAAGLCDFVALNEAFFPMQGPGFVLIAIALLSIRKKDMPTGTTALAVAPAVYTSNLIFIAMQILGYAGVQLALFKMAGRMRRRLAQVLFVLAFVFMIGMGYLGAKFDDSSSMHWLAQITNIFGQGSMLAGVLILRKGGLGAKPGETD